MINNNSDDVYCFDSYFRLDRTSRKMFGANRTIEDVLVCTSAGHQTLPVKLVDVMVTVNLCHTLSLVWVKWKFP